MHHGYIIQSNNLQWAERVKVMMQAQQNSLYANELECVRAVLQNEGWTGLFSRGLGPTLAREVPSYGIYFVVYGVLMQTAVAENLGSVAPLIFGAIRCVLSIILHFACVRCFDIHRR